VIDLPAFIGTATLKQLLFGYTETIEQYKRQFDFNCVPESPYEVLNLIANSTFESGISGWTAQNGATLTQSSTWAWEGTYSGRIAPNGSTPSPQIQATTVLGVSPGSLNTALARFSSAVNQTAYFQIHFYDSSGTHIVGADLVTTFAITSGASLARGVSGLAPSVANGASADAARAAVFVGIQGTPGATDYLYTDGVYGYSVLNVNY
jgi:hypothetical protein